MKEEDFFRFDATLKMKKKEETKISGTLNLNRKFRLFLKKVVDEGTCDNFSEIQDILDRYRTLKSTNTDLMAQMQKNTEQHEDRRSIYTHFMKFGSNELLSMNNEIVCLQKEMEKVSIMHNNMKNLNNGTNRNATDLTADISQILVVINNLAEILETRAHPQLILFQKTEEKPK